MNRQKCRECGACSDSIELPLDFEAIARQFGGVISAHVEWAWDETVQGAAVKVWFISDGDVQRIIAAAESDQFLCL
jgi:hypothetical protein